MLLRLETARLYLRTVFGEILAFLDVLAVPRLAFFGYLAFFVLEHFAVYSRGDKQTKVGGKLEGVSAAGSAFAINL